MSVLRLGRRVFGPEELLVMATVSAEDPAAALGRVHAVAAEGADAVEIGGVPGATHPREATERVVPFVAAVREAHPGLVIGVSTGQAAVARAACAAGADLLSGPGAGRAGVAGVAAEFGAGVVCLPGAAGRAVELGVEPERVIVSLGRVRELEELVATGWPVLVSPSDQEPAGSLATAALAAWLGARVFRVHQVLQTRRALRMVSAIRGDIPAAYAVRGLALSLVTDGYDAGGCSSARRRLVRPSGPGLRSLDRSGGESRWRSICTRPPIPQSRWRLSSQSRKIPWK